MSIKKKKGRCPKCGALLIGDDGKPTDNIVVDADKLDDPEQVMFCGSCAKKHRAFVVGTIKSVPENVAQELAKDMYKGMNWKEVQKMVNAKATDANKQQDIIKSLKGQIRQLEFQKGILEGTVNNLKATHEKALNERDKRIQDLTKELEELEHRFDKLSNQLAFGKSEDLE